MQGHKRPLRPGALLPKATQSRVLEWGWWGLGHPPPWALSPTLKHPHRGWDKVSVPGAPPGPARERSSKDPTESGQKKGRRRGEPGPGTGSGLWL